MTVRTVRYLECDWPECKASHEIVPPENREFLVTQGEWFRRSQRDYCPEHAAAARGRR